ncbi:hypothetical protein Tco_1234725, partial [Tanacetum coccineum]
IMDITKAKQIALDDALVAPANRLKIGCDPLALVDCFTPIEDNIATNCSPELLILGQRPRSSLLCASCVFLLRREQKHILALEMPLSLSQMIQTIDLLSSFHVQWKTVGLPQCTQGGVKVLEWCEFCLVATVHVGGERDDE